MKVVAEEQWSWMLFEDGDRWFLSVVCGTVGIYTVDFELDVAEKDAYQAHGRAYIAELASRVMDKPDAYTDRKIQDFHRWKEATAAAALWRSQHDNLS